MRQRDELELLQGRITILAGVIVVVLGILMSGFWYHQMMQTPHYTELAERQSIKEIPVIAPRGRIYDRFNRILADNRPAYNIVLIRQDSPHTEEETVALLMKGIDSTEAELMERINRRRKEARYRPIVLKEDIPVAEIAYLKAHQYELPEISVEPQPRRLYFEGSLAAHILGYVGEVTEKELTTAEFITSESGDLVGKAGLEKTYNTLLTGTDGFRRVIVNKYGREMERLHEEPPVPGHDLYTTIDLDLQKAAEEVIGDRAGAAVAIDPRTGEVLVLASKPAFDPNLFPGIPADVWKSLINDPQKPLRNRAVQDMYSPGSVFKIFMAAAGLEANTLDPLEHYHCGGSAVHYGNSFGCWKAGGHGDVGIHEAIVSSCNVFFYAVGKALGIDRIAQYTTAMGLGRKTGIDLPNEIEGIIPSPEWKMRAQKAEWFPGETISVSIGQGAVNVTPLQAAWAMGGLASGGRLKTPHMVSPEKLRALGMDVQDVHAEEYPLHQSTVDVVTKAMWGVVNEPGGTAGSARVEGFDVAGKTGTAQVVNKQFYASGGNTEDHAWFAGVAPYRNPELAIAVFIEHGGHGGSAAAPVAHAIFDAYYKKKTGSFDGNLITKVASLESND